MEQIPPVAPPRKGRSRTALLAIGAVVLVVFCGCVAAMAAGVAAVSRLGGDWAASDRPFGAGAAAERAISQTVAIGDAANLVINFPVGDVHVTGTDGDEVVVEGVVRAKGRDDAAAQENLERYRLDVTHEGQTVRITGAVDEEPGQRGFSNEVELNVRVPRRTTVDLTADVGDVHVEGTEADANIQTDVARVVIVDVSPTSELTVATDVGAIEFEGALVDGARYDFKSEVGAIDLRIPRASKFNLDARSNVGAVTSEFEVKGPSSGSAPQRNLVGAVNGGSKTTVSAKSGVGAVTLEAR